MKAEPEYSSLRQEILQSESQIVGIATFTVTIYGAAMAAAFELRNPFIALLSLLVLSLGHVIVFNNALTIMRIGSYLRIFWEVEHPAFKWETRLAEQRNLVGEKSPAEQGSSGLIGKLTKWLQPRGALREEWMAPLTQRMFFGGGIVAIVVYAFICLVILFNPLPGDLITSSPLLNWSVFLLLLAIALVSWIGFILHNKRQTKLLYGSGNLMNEMELLWGKVKNPDQPEDQTNVDIEV